MINFALRYVSWDGESVISQSSNSIETMYYCLFQPELIEKLIVVDITQLNMSHNADQITEMLKILRSLKIDDNQSLSQARKDTSEILSKIGLNQATRDFVLLNLVKNSHNAFEWRINLEGLMANVWDVFNFPQKNLNSKYTGDTLFIAGADSNYIQKKDIGKIKINFPKAEFEFIERAGHLVHVEQPAKFIEVVTKFLNSK